MIELNKIYNEDCLGDKNLSTGMWRIPDKSVDMILCDLPYGVGHCKWDSVIPFEPLWTHYKRVIKDNGAIVLFSQQPFTSFLVTSNIELYRYNWVWEKDKPTNFVMANKQPMKYHEDICVFYKKQPTYNKQMIPRTEGGKKRAKKGVNHNNRTFKVNGEDVNIQGKEELSYYNQDLKNPSTIIYFDTGRRQDLVHPTQKPLALFEYLIKTYTNENEVVLDNCMGSGTTAIASLKLKRKYIGFELESDYYDKANKRIELHKSDSLSK
ncbi:site-specific DNA-methyltransferase [Ureibacillus chungkukjangi]|uniref:DNA-methyltransferase n=1 Tax=Ureibacillus chungkukjangi TaxID=1202712 RepID=UPI0020415D11|nr:site-specific DNA-methyltransferase [Ureibacillus chungkukjangi]MCM3387226.1 site-specific DNA-methyltransferase [Ureibacillus chungkukjangi]